MRDPMRKLRAFLYCSILMASWLAACGVGQDESDGTTPRYKVKESTGLYSALAIDAVQIAVLPKEAVLVPADGQTTLLCDTFVDSGLKYALCKVELLETGQTGWVLQMFLEKY